MRPGAALLLVLVLSGCPSPEDAYLLNGQIVDQDGRPAANREVRVLRDASPDAQRCLPMEPFTTLTTGADGRFSVTVFRQQQTLGALVPRFFRVEASSDPFRAVSAWTFRFAATDVSLPPLPIALGVAPTIPTNSAEVFSESLLDGAVAWRTGAGGAGEEDRAMPTLAVARRSTFDVLPTTPFGAYEALGLELRFEQPLPDTSVGTASKLRGFDCDGVAPRPCPLTDGRMLPVALPKGTKGVSLTGSAIVVFRAVVVRGLRVEGEPTDVVVEATESLDEPRWETIGRLLRTKELVASARGQCRESGLFATIEVGVRAARGVRIRADDQDRNALDLVSLQELSAR